MKKIIITFAVLFIAGSIVSAQEKKPAGKAHMEQVPQAVTDSFAKKYPDVKNAHWEKEGKRWEAEIKQNGGEIKMIYDAMGNFLYTETSMQVSELPKEVMEFMAANYSGSKVTGAGKIIDANGVMMYEVELKGTAHLFFDAKGEFLNRED